MSWSAILALAAGAYVLKAVGLLVIGPAMNRSAAQADGGGPTTDRWPIRLGQLLPPALLAALVVNQTLTTGTQLVIDARLAGVAAGAVAVWRGAPFWLVLVIAAAVAALVRLAT